MEETNLVTRAVILEKYCKHYAAHTDCPQKEVLKRTMTRLWSRFLESPLALESFYDDLGLEGCGASSTTTSSEPEALDLNAPTTPSTQNTETIPRSFEVDERESMRVPDRFSCPICLEEHQVNQSAQCYALMCKEGLHYYCLDCLHSLVIIQDEPKCVLCRQVIPEDEKRQVIRLYEQAHVVVISDDPIEEDEEEEEEIPLAPPRRTNSNANELAPSGWLSVASLRRNTSRGNPERATDRSTKSFRTCSCCHDSALVGQAAIWCNECSHSYNASHFLKVMTRAGFKKCPKCKVLGRRTEVNSWNYRDYSLTFLSGNRVMVMSRITDDSTPAIKNIKKRATPRGTEWYIDL